MIDTQENRNEQALELCDQIFASCGRELYVHHVLGRKFPGLDKHRESIRNLAPYRGVLQRFTVDEIEEAWCWVASRFKTGKSDLYRRLTESKNGDAGTKRPPDWPDDAAKGFWPTLHWFMLGNPTLLLTRQQIAALAFSETVEQQIKDVRLPWNVFYMPMPRGLLRVGSSYVDEIEVQKGKGILWDDGIERLWKHGVEIHWEMISECNTGECMAPSNLLYGDENTTKEPLDIGYEEPKEQWREERRRLDEFVSRIVFNAIYAINEGHKIEKTSTGKMRDYSDQRYITGHKLNLPIKIDNVKYLQMGVSGESGRQYTARWMVRGHWREQACGKDRKGHRRIFIEPHWKGPEAGTILQRNYKVTDEVVRVD